jgi:hypothetical protein
VKTRALLLVIVAVVLAACATASRDAVDLRTTRGPTAQQLWLYRALAQTGREPTFEERNHWDSQLEARISAYLRQHPEAANSLDVSAFRFDRQVAVGMAREQVVILLGAPAATTTDRKEMERLARRFWPELQANVTEAWTYPLGWQVYFAGARLIDITRYIPE